MKIQAIDFFSGCGGTTHGFLKAGIDVLCGVDNDPHCELTYTKNNPGVKFICQDIAKLTVANLLEQVKIKKHSKLLLSGCAPCQPFSTKGKGSIDDSRRPLLLQFGRFVSQLNPDFVFVENVPGIQKIKGNSTFSRFLSLLEEKGFDYTFKIVDTKKFGIPQTRKRLILIASKGGFIEFPNYTHGEESGLKPYKTVRDAIGKMPAIKAGENHPTIPNHYAKKLSPLNLKRIQSTPEGGNRLDWPKKLWLECHKNDFTGHKDVYGRMSWDKPAPTLTCRCMGFSNGRYGHPEQDRAISGREAALIQTFPKSFKFYCGSERAAQLIGNAVPVKLAKIIGENFFKCGLK